MARTTSANLAMPNTSASAVSGRPLDLFLSLRPNQWSKNLLVFAALIFAGKLFDRNALRLSVEAFAIFCALSGVVYILNDILDREQDRLHPLKRVRPIAAGKVSAGLAAISAATIAAVALTGAFALNRGFGWVSAAYLALMTLYSLWLK